MKFQRKPSNNARKRCSPGGTLFKNSYGRCRCSYGWNEGFKWSISSNTVEPPVHVLRPDDVSLTQTNTAAPFETGTRSTATSTSAGPSCIIAVLQTVTKCGFRLARYQIRFKLFGHGLGLLSNTSYSNRSRLYYVDIPISERVKEILTLLGLDPTECSILACDRCGMIQSSSKEKDHKVAYSR